MDIHFLGVLGYQPYREKHTSCIMMPEYGIVLDAGTGFHLVREHIKTVYLDVFLSHLHDDHICGTLYPLGMLYKKQIKSVVFYGRRGIETFFRKRQFAYPRFPVSISEHEKNLSTAFGFHVFSGEQPLWIRRNGLLFRQYAVSAFQLPHPSRGSLAYDFMLEGKRVVYVTDTTLDVKHKKVRHFMRALQTGQPPDLLISECNFTNGHEDFAQLTGHTFPRVLAEFLKEVNPRSVALTHLHPHSDEYGGDFFREDILAWQEVQQEYGRHVLLARQNMVLQV